MHKPTRQQKIGFYLILAIVGAQLPLAAEEPLHLEVVSYEELLHGEPAALERVKSGLLEQGIIGIKAIPGYKEKVRSYLNAAREFISLPEELKETCARKEGEMFLGYEKGKEKFQLPDGTWVIDDLKTSYYGIVPDCEANKWPREVELQGPFLEVGTLMGAVGKRVMEVVGLIGEGSSFVPEEIEQLGRMLYYAKNENQDNPNPYWCGAHFDHALFTALLPAFYFAGGVEIPEPEEAGLFVRMNAEAPFKKVTFEESDDLLLFQVGEFGQLISNDAVRATEHRVSKAVGAVERYTLALFFSPPMETVIRSHSILTEDSRYGGKAGDPCSYEHWNEATFKRYIVEEEK